MDGRPEGLHPFRLTCVTKKDGAPDGSRTRTPARHEIDNLACLPISTTGAVLGALAVRVVTLAEPPGLRLGHSLIG